MCIALGMGNMIGSGVFLLPRDLAPLGWNAVIGWGVTITGTLCLALIFARLSRRLPGGSAAFTYANAAFGPGVGFIVAWSYWISCWTANATLALAAISNLSVEGRLTVSNMAIEHGARAGLCAPDEKTFAYLKGRPMAPKGADWDAAVAYWQTLKTDPGATFDKVVVINAADIAPSVTWGTSPEDVVPITGTVPDPKSFADPSKQEAAAKSLAYMGLEPGTPLNEVEVQNIFIGSCTNSRIEDLRAAAAVLKGKRKAANIKWAIVVPGSGLVKAQAEAEGLDRIFIDAGLEWREPGCSACLGMNPDKVPPGERCASTSNRNFVGRQGPGARTHLVSPAMAAAAAVTGRLADGRELVA